MFVYSPHYDASWLGHVFPVEKYRLTYDRLLAEGIARPEDFREPARATREELERVHSGPYLDRLERAAEAGLGPESEFEAPLTRGILEGVLWSTGGTVLACRLACRARPEGKQAPEAGGTGRLTSPGSVDAGAPKSEGPSGHGAAALNLAGGYHHAFRDRGGGFCFVNDVAVAVAAALAEGLARRVMVVDCDVHQGNGTARIFRDEPRVFTLDIHQERNYPVKERASLDIGLADGAGDEEYLMLLGGALARHVPAFAPDLVLYDAGADAYGGDQLGGLALTKAGLARRDEVVLSAAREAGAALAAVLGGSYPADVADAVDVHVETARRVGAFRAA